MLDFLRKKFRPRTTGEKQEHQEMVMYIVRSCLKSTCIVLALIVAFEMFFFVNSLIHPSSFGNLGIRYRVCYFTLMSVSAVSLLIIWWCRKKYRQRYQILLWLSPIYCMVITGWSLAITYLDTLKSQKASPILFMTIILCVPACMYMNPVFYLVLELVTSSLMLRILFLNPTGADSADILNFIVFVVIQTVVSMFFLITRYGYYRSLRQGLLNEQKARKATEAKAATLSNMSHELRTPLNAILGMNELIRRADGNGALGEYTDSIREAGDTLLLLVNDMLDFSKLEAGKMKMVTEPYRLSEVVLKVCNMMQVLAQKKNLDLRLEMAEDTPDDLVGDAQRISQLLINLINNAIKYTREGHITLKVCVEGTDHPRLYVEVQDTGIGIRREDQAYLFDSFSQVDDEYNHHIEGTGLGLMICERFVHLMEGEIGVRSEYGEGSVFWFRVPQKICGERKTGALSQILSARGGIRKDPCPAEHEGKETSSGKENESGAEGFPQGGRNREVLKVLVVDDTEMNRRVMVKLLEGEPVEVDTADSGEQCLERIRSGQYDLILLDHLMPGMDGVGTLRAIRSQPREWCQKVPVVALTANGGSGAREEYLGLGFDDYLAKPIRPDQLSEMIERMKGWKQ